MSVIVNEINYTVDGTVFDGAIAINEGQIAKRPAIMVFHGWEGRSEEQTELARSLTTMGYIGFACDVFGNGLRGNLNGDNSSLIAPLLQDRELLLKRLVGTARFVQSLPDVDPNRVVAIGFCFGGLCVLDLARSGIDIQAVACFHGLYVRPKKLPIIPIKAKVIVFHGWDDPMLPAEDMVALGKELTEAKADWQLHAYGNTMHAFMAPSANRPEAGIQYSERSAKRAWDVLEMFLAKTLGE
jgi:dienelactone hydrolase